MRKLASIQTIVDIAPIEGADKIEVCTVLGWHVVIAKHEGFKVGDQVIYIEVDSVVPPRPEFEFLKERKYRVRTIKLRKQISQGLVLPLSLLPSRNWQDGDDVTELLGVTKYDPQLQQEQEEVAAHKSAIVRYLSRYAWFRNNFLPKKQKGWPTWIKKTDEERLQGFPKILQTEAKTLFQITEKVDGQSATYSLKRNRTWWGGTSWDFGVYSRNHRRGKPDNSSYWTISHTYCIEAVLREICTLQHLEHIVLQGEIIGTGIQKNKYQVNGYEFYAYNLIYPDRQLGWYEMDKALSPFDIKCVPLIDGLNFLPATVDEAVKFAIGRSLIRDAIQREGIVVRNYQKGISFKIINPEFLLHFGE